jgi:hypothetical protein
MPISSCNPYIQFSIRSLLKTCSGSSLIGCRDQVGWLSMMVPTFKSKTLITDLYSMNPPDSRVVLLFYHPIYSLIIAISYDRWSNQTRSYQSQGCMLRWCLHAITLSYPPSRAVDCRLAQSRSNYFRIPSDVRLNIPGSVHQCCITVDCMWARRLWWQKLLRTGLVIVRAAPWCFFGNA